MENKRWFQEKLSDIEDLNKYVEQVFIEYLDELAFKAEQYTLDHWEHDDEDYITVYATYLNDYEDDVFKLKMDYFYEDNPESRRNIIKDEYTKKQKKERLEKERKEQERLEQKRRQFHKLKQELGEE